MKSKYFLFTLLFTFIFTIKPINAQYDISVKISETEINKALAALIEARGLNWGKYNGDFIDAWYVNIDSATADILPNNQVIVNANVVAVWEINLWLFTFPYVAHPSGSFVGNFEVIGDQNSGFQLKFVPDYNTFSSLAQIIYDLIPPIEINLGTFVLPAVIQGLFTTSVPYLQTNNNEIILGFNFAGPRKITLQNDFNGVNNVSTIEAYENMQWEEYPSPKNFWWTLNSSYEVRAKSNAVSYANSNWKFYWWNESPSQKNVQKTVIADQDKSETAFFKPVFPLTVQTNLLEGGTGGKILYEGQEKNSPFSDYGFQTPYTTNIGVNNPQLINGRKYFLTNWQDGNTLSYRNISLNSPSTFTANLKGTQLSNSVNAFINNSQRRIVRANSGTIYETYESMGNIFLEKSVNNGSSWELEYRSPNKYLNNTLAKSSAIDFVDTLWNPILVVFQEQSMPEESNIKLYERNDKYPSLSPYLVGDTYHQNNIDVTPIISVYGYNKFIVIWKGWNFDPVYGEKQGLFYRLGFRTLNNISWLTEARWIPNTTANSCNPSVAASKTGSGNPVFHLSWQENISSSRSKINYATLTFNSSNELIMGTIQDISYGSGFEKNYNPTIIELNGGARVSWIGYRDGIEESAGVSPNKINSGDEIQVLPNQEWKTIFRDPSVSRFWQFGNNVNSPNINKANDNSAYFLLWSENNGQYNKFTDSYTLSKIKTLNTTGKDIQLSNGANRDYMRASSFNSTSLPYYFTTSNSIGSYYQQQKTDGLATISTGREGVVVKDGSEFYFSIGDINVNDEVIDF